MRSLTHTIHDLVHDSQSEKPAAPLLWIVIGLCGIILLFLMGIVALVPNY